MKQVLPSAQEEHARAKGHCIPSSAKEGGCHYSATSAYEKKRLKYVMFYRIIVENRSKVTRERR